MTLGTCLRLTALSVTVFLAPTVAVPAAETSPTLRLGQIFQPAAAAPPAEPADEPPKQTWPPWAAYDPSGPPFEFPSPDAFLLRRQTDEPAPEAEKKPGLTTSEPLPWIPPRGFSLRNQPAQRMRPALRDGGRQPTIGLRYSRVQTRNSFSDLCVRIELRPEEGEPLVYLLAPGFGEQFLVEPGRWRVNRTVWRQGWPEAVLREEFEAQDLRPGWQYDLVQDQTEEARLLRVLAQR